MVRGGVHEPAVPGHAQRGRPCGRAHPRLHPLSTPRHIWSVLSQYCQSIKATVAPIN